MGQRRSLPRSLLISKGYWVSTLTLGKCQPNYILLVVTNCLFKVFVLIGQHTPNGPPPPNHLSPFTLPCLGTATKLYPSSRTSSYLSLICLTLKSNPHRNRCCQTFSKIQPPLKKSFNYCTNNHVIDIQSEQLQSTSSNKQVQQLMSQWRLCDLHVNNGIVCVYL